MKTVLRNAAVCAAALDPNISPRDFMLGLVRNSELPRLKRVEFALLTGMRYFALREWR